MSAESEMSAKSNRLQSHDAARPPGARRLGVSPVAALLPALVLLGALWASPPVLAAPAGGQPLVWASVPAGSATRPASSAPAPVAAKASAGAAGSAAAQASPGGAPPAAFQAPANAPAPAAADSGDSAPELQRWIEESAASTWSMNLASQGEDGATGPGVRFEVTLGKLNPGLRLAACTRVEPFLPANARLWGRSFVGVRCIEGASWTTMLPVTVSVFAPALVANLPLAINTLADPGAFRIEEVDLTRVHGQPVTDLAMLEGRALGRPLAAGQVLRANDLRIPMAVSAGDPIRIRLMGQGFTISTEGFAMASAGEGQTLRVRTASGKLLVGTVRSRTVEVKL